MNLKHHAYMSEKEGHVYLKNIGRRINEIRAANGLTQSQLADKLGVSLRLLARWESSENVKVLTLFRISKVLGCQVADFFKNPKASIPKRGRPSQKKKPTKL